MAENCWCARLHLPKSRATSFLLSDWLHRHWQYCDKSKTFARELPTERAVIKEARKVASYIGGYSGTASEKQIVMSAARKDSGEEYSEHRLFTLWHRQAWKIRPRDFEDTVAQPYLTTRDKVGARKYRDVLNAITDLPAWQT